MPVGAISAAPSRAAVSSAAARVANVWQPRVLHAAAAPRRRAQRSVQLCRAAAEAEAGPAPEAPAEGGELKARKPSLMNDDWNKAVQLRKDGEVVELTVASANRSGLVLPFGKLQAFLPYKLVDPARFEQRRDDGSRIPPPPGGHQQLVGAKIKVKVSQVIVPENRLIVSEKAVLLDALAEVVRPGDIIEGVVGSTMEWGAFVQAHTVNGQPCPGAEAVLPMRELSYSWVNSTSDVLTSGQPVRVVVLHSHQAPEAKVVVSLKRLEEDPLKETLDNVLPVGQRGRAPDGLSEVPASVPQGVEEILEELDRQEGITSITLGRCVEEKRTVSQDLELWITKDSVADGYGLAVRAGRVVQEVIVSTQMSPEEMRATVQRVLRSIN